MVLIFFQALLVSMILFWFGLKFSKSKRWGGVVLILVFVGMIFLHRELEMTSQLKGLIVGSLMILVFGLWDDWKNLSWKVQLLFQIFLVGLLLYFGFGVDYLAGLNEQGIRLDRIIWQGISISSAFFILFWVMGIINAVNWADGADFSMGSIAVIGGLSIVFVSFLPEVNQPAVAILASIFLGLMAGFLFFNLPSAKIEAGTSGSYFTGFILASLAIIAGSKIITMMIVLILPLIDVIWVVVGRWRNKKSIFKRDKSHLHYRLRRIGWSDRKIFLSYFVFLGAVLLSYSLLDSREDRFLLLGLEIVLLLTWFRLVDRIIKRTLVCGKK